MKDNLKKAIIAMVFFCAIAAAFLVGRTVGLENKRIHVPENASEIALDEIVEIIVNSDQILSKKTLLGSEEIAREYARILYLENMDNFSGWNNSVGIWVKYYKKYDVWLAKWGRPDEPILDGPPWIVFQASDGKVICYAN
ncbi:MAG: hypothetical protein FWG53_02660 [Clostridiales bacterium]|nr:hypothetical protein [Clostridiales bacterium]